MKIEEVLRAVVAAIFSSDALREILVLKGGAALHLGEGIDNRLSTDIDLSIPQTVTFSPSIAKAEFERTLTDWFARVGFDIIDVNLERRPKTKREGRPEVWGGWNYSFKLASNALRPEKLSTRRRRALIPIGASSSTIEVQISEHEYCEKTRIEMIDQVEVVVYTPALLIAEKIRAICQQHPDYLYRLSKNRARDFFDNYALYRKHRREPELTMNIAEILEAVFDAKFVPLSILERSAMFDPEFIAAQAAGFQQVRNTARGKIQEFTFYVEQVKLLVEAVLAVRTERKGPTSSN